MGSFGGDIDTDVDIDIDVDAEIDVDIDRYFGSLKGVFKVRSATAEWKKGSSGTDFDHSEIASAAEA